MLNSLLGQLWQGYTAIVIVISLTLLVIVVWILMVLWKSFHSNENLKYEFITIIAHKYRTPLTQVKWLCENLLASETDSFKKESITNISQSNAKLIKLTNSLIEVTDNDRSAVASYSFQIVSLCELVRAVAEPFTTVFHEKNIFFSVQCPAEDIRCSVDKQRIEFVLQSLLENARTYTPDGKNVKVVVEHLKNKAIISVIDEGIGIAQEDLSNIFTKFYRSGPAQHVDTEGFGISMFLSKAIMRRHKGSIKVSSPGLDKGTRFDLVLNVV